MKNWQALRYCKDSPQFVIAHGALQRSRGGNPSVAYGDIRNPRLALQLAEQELVRIKNAEELLENLVKRQAEMMERVWRMEENTGLSPLVNFLAVHCEDLVRVKGQFELIVRHVNSFHGKGFSVLVRCFGSSVTGCEVHLGTGSFAYNSALDEGLQLLEREIAKLDQAMREQDRLEVWHHSRRRGSKPFILVH